MHSWKSPYLPYPSAVDNYYLLCFYEFSFLRCHRLRRTDSILSFSGWLIYFSIMHSCSTRVTETVLSSFPCLNNLIVLFTTSLCVCVNFYFVLGYSRLTVLWYFQVNSEGMQPYIYMYPWPHLLLNVFLSLFSTEV